MHALTVTAVGNDRPGIVAGVTKIFYELGCNLSDCSMSRLADQFAMILLVQAPDDLDVQRLESALGKPAGDLGLSVQVAETPHSAGKPQGRPFVASVYGADKPGIVYRIATELAARSVNITDLVSHAAGDNLYMVVLDLELPADCDQEALRTSLAQTARGLGVELTLRPAEAAEF